MADVFQPQVAEINSAVTPREGVVDQAGLQLFSDVAKVATEAAFSFTGQQELTELGSKFEKITQARLAGGNSSTLQVKARTELDAAKANSPWVAEQADKLFRDTFGGGGSNSGAFKATPQEEAREKHTQRVEETRLALGLSTSEEAQKRISLDENAKLAKTQADAQKDVREYNSELVFSNTQAQLNNNSIKFMDAMNRTMTLSGGTLGNDATRELNLTVDQTALQLKQELNTQTRDPNTGHLLIDKAGYDSNLKEIEDWVANTKAMVGDNSYMKIIQELNTEQSAEINFVATQKYRTLKELDAAGGQAAVNAYLVAARTPEGAAKQLLIGANPIAKDMFKQGGSFNQASSDGIDKIVLPTSTDIPMSQPESMATGTVLNDPKNAKVMTTVVEKVATEASAVEPYKSMIKQNPDSSAMLWSDMFKSWSMQNKGKAQDVLDVGMEALKNSFLSAYVSDTGKLPSDFTIDNTELEKRKFGRDVLRRNVVKGDGISKNTGKILSNMLSVLSNNPEYAKRVATEMGVPDDTPQQLVRSIVLGVDLTPDDIAFRAGEDASADTTALPTNDEDTFNALEDSSPEEIKSFQEALRKAKNASEKAEVHAAFTDGQFRRAK